MGLVSQGGTLAVGVIVVIALLCCCPAFAQSNTSFGPNDKFYIPISEGYITFAVNGTYSQASLENDTWVFTNLQLNGSMELQTLRFSAENCNVTILSYRPSGAATQSVRLSYVVEGVGNQTVNLGFNSQKGTINSAAWNVGVGSNHFETMGNGWKLLPDDTVLVLDSTGNVTITHYFFLGPLANNANLPYYEQHSVALTVTIAFIITILAAAMIKIRSGAAQVKKKELG